MNLSFTLLDYLNTSINYTVYVDGTVFNRSITNGNRSSIVNFTLTETVHRIIVEALQNDTLQVNSNRLKNSSMLTVTVDLTAPVVNFSSPTDANNSYFNRNWIYVNVSVNETNEANITFSLSNRTKVVNITTYSSAQRAINWTGLNSNEVYYYNVTVVDKAALSTTTETRILTLDNSAPTVAFVLPLSDAWDNVRCNDSAGNNALNTTLNYTVNVDKTQPGAFDLTSPTNNTVSITRNPYLSWGSPTEQNFLNYTVQIANNTKFNNWTYQYERTSAASNNSISIPDNLESDKQYYWRVIAFDKAGNSRNSTNFYYYETDNTPPNITSITVISNSRYFFES